MTEKWSHKPESMCAILSPYFCIEEHYIVNWKQEKLYDCVSLNSGGRWPFIDDSV